MGLFLVDDSLLDLLVWLGFATEFDERFGVAMTDDDVNGWQSMADIVSNWTRRAAERGVVLPPADDVWGWVAGWVSREFGVEESQITPVTLIDDLNRHSRNARVRASRGGQQAVVG